MKHWLMKSEPSVFSIEDLRKSKSTLWEGVRNYQARNLMNSMQIGDEILFYHSSSEPPGVAGLARVSGLSTVDPSQFDKKSDHFDAKASAEKPIWTCVEVAFVKKLKSILPLSVLRSDPRLQDMALLQRGQRLSVQPVTPNHYALVLSLIAEHGL